MAGSGPRIANQTNGKNKSDVREINLYIIFGGLTTLVNYATFRSLGYIAKCNISPIFVDIFGANIDIVILAVNVIAWAVAVAFAYVVNRIFVFKSSGNPMSELIAFVCTRIFTLIAFETGLFMLLFVILESGFNIPKETKLFAILGFQITWVDLIKIGVQAFVVIFNYVFSKKFIFKNKTASAQNVQEL